MSGDSNIGRVLQGKYELIRLLGKGGMGAVYEAKHLLIGRRLAIKLLHAAYAQDQSTVQRFRREAQTATAIGHEHIVDVTDMGVTDTDELFIVMEFLEGMDLAAILKMEPYLSHQRACHIMIQILSALEAAHAKGIVHRDLKPANVFITKHGAIEDYVKLVDFGISKVRVGSDEAKSNLTRTGELLGTPLFMSPEQARGEVDITAKSDIFSCGVILYKMVTGALPFEDKAMTLLLIKIMQSEPMSPTELRPDTPPALVQAIKRAMAKNSDDRFEDAAAFRRMLTPLSPNTAVLTGLKHTRVTKSDPNVINAIQRTLKTSVDRRDHTPIALVATFSEKRTRKVVIAGALAAVVLLASLILVLLAKQLAPQPSSSEPTIPATGVPLTVPTSPPTSPPELSPAVPPISKEPPLSETAEAPPAVQPKMITFSVQVSPAEAVVVVDGVPYEAGSVRVQREADGKPHEVVVSASRHDEYREQIVFDKTVALVITLKREARTHSRTVAEEREDTHKTVKDKVVPPEVKTAEPPKGSTTAPSDKGTRPIDLSSPW